ncbi:hypothetical protein BUALT_Bualt02G0161700 [Buddleja alternifolia]|uniref:Uncharacterized protein n=1 Tax=Buddleja alternifolia TaxID=168488 RepID=A0AAV6Y7S7_9LAMI|nr:hypothetical protein BUALT_Bualt02G0161700 [Buddleja alternifolia]
MSSACSVPRLVRCRVRDLASCFYACRSPLEEEPDNQCSKQPQMPNKSIKRERRRHETSKKMSIVKNEEGESVQSSSLNKGAEPSFAEEDYIVFCFREDGAIHMIDECKSSSQSFHDQHPEFANTTSNKPINNKVHNYGEGVGRRREGGDETSCEEQIPISNAKDDDDEKGTKEEMEKKEINSVVDDDVDFEQPNAQKMESSFESCDSNLSDTSTNSFAFPVLSIEWMGSPVHMPKSDNHQMCLHCCRF